MFFGEYLSRNLLSLKRFENLKISKILKLYDFETSINKTKYNHQLLKFSNSIRLRV